MIRNIIAAAALALFGMSAAHAAPPIPLSIYAKPARLVTLPDGRKMNLFCLGAGSPTIMLDTGLGGFSASWYLTHATLAERTQTCAFDRAGLGFSDPGQMPRDATNEVSDQRALLKAAGIREPIVLVASSMAGLNARVFASTYPREVAGLVLVDPSSPYQDRRLNEASPTRRREIEASPLRRCGLRLVSGELKPGDVDYAACVRPLPANYPDDLRAVILARAGDLYRHQTVLSESDAMAGSSSQAVERTKRSLGAMPLIVLTATNTTRGNPLIPEAEQEAMAKVWSGMHDEIAVLSTRGENRQIVSGHGISAERPDAVVAAVDDVLAQIAADRRGRIGFTKPPRGKGR